MSGRVSFYRLETGLFTGDTFDGSDERVAANTPEGCAAFEGLIDHLSRRVDVKSGELVDWRPEPPPADEWCTWRWDDTLRRYVAEPTAAALKRDAAAPVLAQLAALDLAAIRPLVEISVAMASATEVPVDAKAALSGINEQKVALRQALRDIEAEADPKGVRP